MKSWGGKGVRRYQVTVFFFVFVVVFFSLILLPPIQKYIAFKLVSHHQYSMAYLVNYSDSRIAMQVGSYYFSKGGYNLQRAKKSFQLASQLDSRVHLAHYQLARIYFVEGEYGRAISEIDKELVLAPDFLRSLYVRGLIEISQKKLVDAEKDFADFVAWSPTEWGGYNDLAFVLAKEGKYTESEKVVEEAFEKVPNGKDNPWLWNSLGVAQLNQYHYQDAGKAFATALPLAQALTPEMWHRAYSGNDPAAILQSITAFQNAIESNVKASQGAHS